MTERTFAPASRQFPETNKKLQQLPKESNIVVAGAGVFGAWTALMLQEAGYKVCLVDPWGPGNSMSTSGGETRLVRSIYGDNQLYFEWTLRSIELLEKYQKLFDNRVYFQIGTLWFCHEKQDPLIDAALDLLDKRKVEYEKISIDRATELYPYVNFEDLEYVLWEKHSGYVFARESVMATVRYFEKIGGKTISARVNFDKINHANSTVTLNNNQEQPFDFLIAACGPWLGKCFPDAIDHKIEVSKQDVLFFGLPDRNAHFFQKKLPSWVDKSTGEFFYGLPQGTNRGFKIALDRRGENFDPERDDRLPNQEIIEDSRRFIAHRFPTIKNMPLVESRVCQYSNTIDGNFICDLHPENDKILMVGGGSGHGFKHGPALAEYITQLIDGRNALKADFAINNK